MAGRPGLVPVKRMVVRNGRSYQTTVYIRPGDQKKTQNTNIQIPDWNFPNLKSFEDEVARINKLKDTSEKKVIKEHLVEFLKQKGVSFKEDNGPKADDINWMRVLMAAKKQLRAGNPVGQGGQTTQQPQQPTPTPQPQQPSQPQSSTTPPQSSPNVVLGTGQNMSKDDAKKAVKELREKIGTQAMIDLAEKNGIQWAKNPNHIANSYMQLAMKLSKHLQAGGTLSGDGKPQSQATTQPNQSQQASPQQQTQKKSDTPKLDPFSIEHDYYHATKRQKMVGMITGLLPTDDDTAKYLEDLIKAGKFDLENKRKNGDDTGIAIAKAYKSSVKNIVRGLEGENPEDILFRYDPKHVSDMFQGTPLQADYEKYTKDYAEYTEKYGRRALTEGVRGINREIETLELLSDIVGTKDLKNMTKAQLASGLVDYFEELTKVTDPTKIDEAWDKLELDKCFGTAWSRGSSPVRSIVDMIDGSFWEFSKAVDKERLARYPNYTRRSALLDAIENGTISKKDAIKFLYEVVSTYETDNRYSHVRQNKAMASFDTPWGRPDDMFLFGKWADKKFEEYLNANGNPVNVNMSDVVNFSLSDAVGYLKNAIKDSEELNTDDARFIALNVTLNSDTKYYNLKPIDNWQPIDKDLWNSSRDKQYTLEQHMWLLKKTPANREKWLNKEKKKLANKQAKRVVNYFAEFNKGTDPDTLDFPDYKGIRKKIKSSMEKVGGDEAAKIEGHIQRTHDNVNHRSFRTVVHGVYRLKNLPIEEDFQKIDDARNTTGFYYHGTGYKAAQKILGESGQFIVTKTNVKAGRMLGDGVYLADNSSKSVQYASDDYGRSNARGVLYLCKASLGNVTTSTVRGSTHNSRLLNQSGVDTVFMDRPYVLNPEWAVKEEKAVIPRLWIDVERVNR